MSTALPPIVELTGPLIIGHFFNWGLFGVLSVQAFLYYLAFPNDRIFPTKILAYGIYLFEIAQVAVATHDAFRNFATSWGNQAALDDIGAVWFSVPIMGSVVSATSQIFYAWRVWILSERPRLPLLPMLIVALSLMQSIAGIYDGHTALVLGKFSLLGSHTLPVTPIWLAGTAACDVVIAASMTYYLWRARSAFDDSNTIIVRLIAMTVETGTLCAVVAIIELAMFLAYPHNNYHIAPALALSKLYSNSLFAVLNARVRIIGGRTGDPRDKDPTLSQTHQPTPTALTWRVGVNANRHRLGVDTMDDSIPHMNSAINVTVTRDVRGDESSVSRPESMYYGEDENKPIPRDMYNV